MKRSLDWLKAAENAIKDAKEIIVFIKKFIRE